MNNLKEANSHLAALESQVDLLETELCYIDQLLLKCGFPEGIKTLKSTMEELVGEEPADLPEEESEGF